MIVEIDKLKLELEREHQDKRTLLHHVSELEEEIQLLKSREREEKHAKEDAI